MTWQSGAYQHRRDNCANNGSVRRQDPDRLGHRWVPLSRTGYNLFRQPIVHRGRRTLGTARRTRRLTDDLLNARDPTTVRAAIDHLQNDRPDDALPLPH